MFASQGKGSAGKSSAGSFRSDNGSASGDAPVGLRNKSQPRYGATLSPVRTQPASTSVLSRFWARSTPVTSGKSPTPEQRPTPSPAAAYRVPTTPRDDVPQSRPGHSQPRTPLQPRPLSPQRRNLSQLPTTTTAQATGERDKEYRRAPFVCEFLGTAMLAFTVCCCKFSGNSAWNAATIGCAYMVLTYAVGPASGGNLNPAVSFTLALLGKLRWPVAAGYILVQTIGALLGTNVAKLVLFSHAEPRLLVAPLEPYRLREAAEVEALYTAMLCFVVANCLVSQKNNPAKDQNQFYGLAIGFSIIAGGYASGKISGGCLNPALALSLNNTDMKDGLKYGFEYAGFEMLGSCLAAALYCMCRPSSEDDNVDRRQFGDQISSHSLRTRIASEFIGTFFLAVTVGFCLVLDSPATPVAAAAALMSMVYSVGTVSGGHFNPAVTVAVVLGGRGKCSVPEGGLYILVQTIAGVAAGVFVAFVHGFVVDLSMASVLAPKTDYIWSESMAAELVFTTLLAYVVLTVTTSPALPSYTKQPFYFGLAVGACYIVGGFAIGQISGGVLNPAVATGVAAQSTLIVSFGSLWRPSSTAAKVAHMLGAEALREGAYSQIQNLFQFTIAELMGGALASGIFGLTHPQEFDTYAPHKSAAYNLNGDKV